MTDTNPLQFCERLRATLHRYLSTTIGVSDDYPDLARRIRSELEHTAELVKEPDIEALPDYEKGRRLADLFQDGLLHADWKAMQGSPVWKRPLHIHQETALLRAAADDNYLVGTGMGGKTEAFLYPMIDDILRDPDRSRPGVRSVIVYPLNALANDQLYYRLAPLLLRELGDLGITFGGITSAVGAAAERPWIEDQLRSNDALMEVLGSPRAIPSSWLLSRREMLESPPHILITNYAMLEHLLLLPRNAPLFASARLQSLVLDELHTYTGCASDRGRLPNPQAEEPSRYPAGATALRWHEREPRPGPTFRAATASVRLGPVRRRFPPCRPRTTHSPSGADRAR